MHKDFTSDANTNPVSVGLSCGAGTVVTTPQNASDNPDSPAVFTVTGIPVGGTTCTASEGTSPSGYTANESTCLSVSLAANGSASCTITNTLHTADIFVFKNFIPDSGASVPVSVICTSGTPSPASGTVSESTSFLSTVTGFNTGATCTVTETTVPTGYAETDDCANLAIIDTGTAACTITNTAV